MSQQKKFFLQVIDEHTDCPIHEEEFLVDDIKKLSRLVDPIDPDLKFHHDLPRQVADRIIQDFRVSLNADGRPVRLRPEHAHDELPYKVHTGRELLLMLQGLKPLSVFLHRADEEPSHKQFFDPYVDKGYFIEREFDVVVQLRDHGASRDLIFCYLLYARKHEEWRIDAYLLLLSTRMVSGWSEALERMEGTLLGYEEWQNNAFIELMKKQRKQHSKE